MRAVLAVGSKTLPFIGGANVEAYRNTLSAGWAQNFLFAGTSAFLLLAVNLFPSYWYLSFFALTPFLYRVIRLDALGALQLGLLFGFSFFSIWKLPDFLTAPLLTVLTVSLGTTLFGLFGWAVARAKEKFGFNPLFVALFWVLFELGLLKLNLLSDAGAGSPRPFLAGETSYFHPSASLGVFDGLSVLFGFLAVSFVIVLVNSILVFAIEKTISLAKARGQGVWENGSVWDLTPIPGLFAQKVYLLPIGRAPPQQYFLLE